MMKNIILLATLLFPLFLSAQKRPAVEVTDKKDGSTIFVNGKNNSKTDQEVELILTSKGFGYESEKTFTKIILAKSKMELLELTPEAGEKWSYSYKVKFGTHHNKAAAMPDPRSGSEKISIFTDYGCNRSGITMNYLKNKKVKFKEHDISKGKKNKELLNQQLSAHGIENESLVTPVIVVDDKVYANIENLYLFLEKLAREK